MDYDTAVTTRTTVACQWMALYLYEYFHRDVDIEPSDFEWVGSCWTIDGMDPREWCEAMTMD